MRDLHLLPKVRDSWSYLYVEHCRIDQEGKAIAMHDARGRVAVPCATLTLLMLGPGTSITHAAVRALAENGCLVVWAGEEGVRLYAQGMGETRSARNLLRQARLWADTASRLQVVERMYRMRFREALGRNLTLRQIRGKEGIRVREAYAQASRASGIPWRGRVFDRGNWRAADPVNRALSTANSCLYGVCHAAIVSAGYSPALGFIHTGKMLSFVYDIA
ncbi:MAG: type I-E CRISPR-associated endonuclease Cas1, partial [Chloroflexi bacterium]|nr:type I-E CRISPR-associated endonuclease Cas1 [Chloroflexota bacterium]